MLRRPSALCATQREEGCSSTAFAGKSSMLGTVWSNLTSRGSVPSVLDFSAAVP
jgi:hypothetical protein